MQCPVCKSVKIKSHLVQPINFGGYNTISHFSCEICGILFNKTEFDVKDEDYFNSSCRECTKLFGCEYATDEVRLCDCYRSYIKTKEKL